MKKISGAFKAIALVLLGVMVFLAPLHLQLLKPWVIYENGNTVRRVVKVTLTGLEEQPIPHTIPKGWNRRGFDPRLAEN